MTNDPRGPRILNDLLDELESVRVGRSVRRKATTELAVVALLVTIVVLSLPSSPTPVAPGPIAVNPAPQPVIEDQPAPESPEPVELATSGRVEIIDSVTEFAHVEIAEPTALRHVEFMTDNELIRALRETNTPSGLATFGGRTVLTSSPTTPAPEPDAEPTTF